MNREPNALIPIDRAPHDSEVNIADLWRTLRRRWAMLIGVSALVTALVMAVTLLITPVFESEAVLRVRASQEAGGMLEELLPIAGLSLPGIGNADVETEVGILQSRRIADLVVDSVALHVELTRPWRTRRSQVIDVIAAGPNAVRGVYSFHRRPDGTYSTSFEGDNPPAILPSGIRLGHPFSVGNMMLALMPTLREDPPSLVRIRVRPFQRVVTRFRDRFHVARQDARSQLIDVSFRHSDPAVAAGVVNSAIDYFLDFSRSAEQAESRRKVRILGEQVAVYAEDLREAETRRQSFQERELIIAPEEQANQQVRRIAEVQAAHDAMRVERAALSTLLERIGASSADPDGEPPYRQLASFPSFIANGVVQDVLQTLMVLENERASLLGRRTERNEDVLVLDRRISDLQGQLYNVGANFIQGLDHQIEAAEVALAGFGAELEAIPAVEVEFARLVREQQLLSELYLLLQAQLREAQVQEAIDDAMVRVIDYGQVMERAAFPRPLVSLVLASVLGLMAGLFAVVGYESANPHVRSRKDAERAAPGVPVLGVIPPIGSGPTIARALNSRIRVGPLPLRGAGRDATDGLVARSDPWHPASEAYRALASTLCGESTAAPGVLVVTSARPDEGKSRLAANLAIALARTGTRTVLVDADLRAAELTSLVGSPASPGWPRLLRAEIPFDEVVRDVTSGLNGEHPPLHFLPAGPLGPHPAEILGAPATRTLFADLRNRYGAVVVDAPPLQVAFDAATLGGFADGVILVVRSGATGREAVELAATDLRRARARLAGVVLTDHRQAPAVAYPYGTRSASTIEV